MVNSPMSAMPPWALPLHRAMGRPGTKEHSRCREHELQEADGAIACDLWEANSDGEIGGNR